ncbi:MAG: acyltransferase [Actinomycetales bacterium]|nr:acyltransferase [Actinomycetales bacterium]
MASVTLALTKSRGLSLGVALAGHNNSLGLLRFVFASLVIFSHAFPLGNFPNEPLDGFSHDQKSMGSLAVMGFFAISGYLITKSGVSSDILQFMWSRVLRIFPAFWVVLIFTALLVGPIVWLAGGGGLASYFNGHGNGIGSSPYSYIWGNAALRIDHGSIYDLFSSTPYGDAINGSLWTLILEWQCYLIVGVLIATSALRWSKIVIPVVAGAFLAGVIINRVAPGALFALLPDFLVNVHFINLGFVFFLGSILAVYSKHIRFDARLALASLAIVIATLYFGHFDLIGTPAFCYLVLFLGAWLPKRLHWIGQKNDYSYGIYIYGFVIEQVLAFAHVNELGYFAYSTSSWLISFGLAWLSWHLIEKRFMALKSWGPGRGITYWRTRRMKHT